ncbi:hypothetical protein QUB74_15995 [Microcoleus sp. A2-C2]|uniref:hypothetical protein n=1 Tax=Microcoleus sp. A2-D3 TaxID=2818537 RepID=UPI002FD29A50
MRSTISPTSAGTSSPEVNARAFPTILDKINRHKKNLLNSRNPSHQSFFRHNLLYIYQDGSK